MWPPEARETGRASFERGFISTTSVLLITMRPRAGWRTRRLSRRLLPNNSTPSARSTVRRSPTPSSSSACGPVLPDSRGGTCVARSPSWGRIIGYAVTCTADSTTEGRRDERGLLRLWEAVEAAPKPAVIVIKDIGPERHRSCHMGEVMATTAGRSGRWAASRTAVSATSSRCAALGLSLLLPRLRRVARQPDHLRHQRRRDRGRAGCVNREIFCMAT